MDNLTTIKIKQHEEARLNLRDCENCFAVPGSDSMIDVVHPTTGKTVIYGRTLEEVRQQLGYEKAELMTVDGFCQAKAERQDTPITWTETTKEKFYEMLEVLPPATMKNGGFLVGEPWDHHALTGRPRYAAYKEREEKFFVASRPMTRQEFEKEIA